jgi:predicted TIM-barrel fold metal-dependent hydrolase
MEEWMDTQNGSGAKSELRVSADSHMAERFDLWETRLPANMRDHGLKYPGKKYGEFQHTRAGGWDPDERLKDMAVDEITAEVLYPTLGGDIYRLESIAHQEACARVYNDWMIEYCQAAPERLWGLANIPLWNTEFAIKEMHRCKKEGLCGVIIWISPPEGLPFYSDHYEQFWAAAQDLEMPVSMHINIGYGPYMRKPAGGSMNGVELGTFGNKVLAMDTLTKIICSGVLERNPRLKIITAEVGAGWVPFWLQELDENYQKHSRRPDPAGVVKKLPMLPSQYFARQVYTTFIDDTVGAYLAGRWWLENYLWSNDYPHPNGIWPGSSDVLGRTLVGLSREDRDKLICTTVARLYNKPVPPPLAQASRSAASPEVRSARLQREQRRNL